MIKTACYSSRTALRLPGVGLLLGLALCCCASPARAQEGEAVDLRRDVLPILRAHCTKCHGPVKHEAGLDLSTPRSLARGGEQGPPVTAGDDAASLLWQRVAADEMPPDEPLADDDKETLRRWIARGAAGLPTVEDARQPGPDHWAFVTPTRPALPKVESAARARTPVDAFILAALATRGLDLAPEADRATLARRVSLDLTGLPPSVDEIATFLADPAEDAYQRLVEHYLASPHYGQRWAQHWLDAAGYADSNGYFHADTDRPLAYRYRDYVVDALNSDKRFDRFIQEQIAGDELVGYERDGDIRPDMAEALVATHFLRNAPDGTGESDGNPDEQRADRFTVLEGTVQIVASSLLGLTVQCARCHDHKFEPITQAEFYGLQSILWPAYCPDSWIKPNQRVASIATRAEREAHASRTKELDDQITALRKTLSEAAAPLRRQLVETKLAALDEPLGRQLRAALDTDAKSRSDDQKSLLKEHEAKVAVSDDELAERFAEFKVQRQEADQAVAQLEAQRPAPLAQIALLTDLTREPAPHHVLLRGDYRALGPEAPPGVPQALCWQAKYEPASEAVPGTGRRLALARWLTSPAHPLLARVTVNRVWQHHFERGLVATPDNFGYTGAPPSHPELLDYLATEFVTQGWSIKRLHRMIVNSATYRQASTADEHSLRTDPDNVFLARYPLRRLDAEAIRDSMLAVAGELDRGTGGPYVPTVRQADGEVVVAADQPGGKRRSIYLQRRRSQIASQLDVFDSPPAVTNCTRRGTSTIPLQSLSLLNSEFILARAAALAARLEREAGASREERISRGFLLCYGRGPRREERAAAEEFLAVQPERYAGQPDAVERSWRDFCQMLLASNAFLYVE